MPRSVLAIANAVLDETQFERVESLLSDDPTATQMRALLNRMGDELARYGNQYGCWPELRARHAFRLTEDAAGNAVEEYAMPADFGRYIVNSMWNATQEWRLAGPLTADRASVLDTYPEAGFAGRGAYFTFSRGRLADGSYGQVLRLWSAAGGLATGDEITFLYCSRNWLSSADGAARDAVASDDDEPVFDDLLVQLALLAATTAARGAPRADGDRRTYEVERDKRYGEAQGARPFNLAGERGSAGGYGFDSTAWPRAIVGPGFDG